MMEKGAESDMDIQEVPESVLEEENVLEEEIKEESESEEESEEGTFDTVAVFKEEALAIEDVFLAQRELSFVEKERRRLKRFLEKLPGDPEEAEKKDRIRKGIGYCLLMESAKALPFLLKVKQDPLGAYFYAKEMSKAGEYENALKGAETFLKKYPDDFRGHSLKISILEKRGDLEGAAKILKSFRSKYKNSADFHYHCGFASDSRGDKQEALESYLETLDLDPDHSGALHRIASLKDRNGEDEEAMEIYELLRRTRPTAVNTLINLGLLYEDHNRFEDAVKCYQEVLDEYPNHERTKLFLKDAGASTRMYYDEEKERKEDRMNQVLRIPITDFELSVRSRNCLAKMDINTLGDLIRQTEAELLSYKNFGETSLTEIKQILTSKNLHLGTGREDPGVDEPKEMMKELFAKPDGEEASILDKTVSELDLSVRSRKAMVQLKIYTLGDLVKKSEADLMACKNFGQTSLTELHQKLSELGLRLKEIVH